MTGKIKYVSGIRPTGSIHLGNYLGAVRQWKSLDGTFFVADLHGLNGLVDETHDSLERCGIAAVVESDYKDEILELSHHLAFHVPVGWLKRMTQFKDKSQTEEATLSLFGYPVLMAADIFFFGGTHIPVGEDQVQHIEFARDLFDSLAAKGLAGSLVKPQAVIGEYPRIMSLTDASRKMSKSDPDDMSRINIGDSPDVIRSKIMAAKSSMSPDDDTPEARNLRTIYRALGGTREHDRWRPFKEDLAELLISELQPR